MGKYGNIGAILKHEKTGLRILDADENLHKSLSDIAGEQEQNLIEASLDSKIKELIATDNEITRLLRLKELYIKEINELKRKLGGN